MMGFSAIAEVALAEVPSGSDPTKVFRKILLTLPPLGPQPMEQSWYFPPSLGLLGVVTPDTNTVIRAPLKSLPDQPPAPLQQLETWRNATLLAAQQPPFFNPWFPSFTFEPDKFWPGTPTDNPALWQLSKPFNTNTATFYTEAFFVELDRGWQWGPQWGPNPAEALYLPILKPAFTNTAISAFESFFYEPDKGWYWDVNKFGPTPADTLLMLAKKPFFNTWAVDYSEAFFLEPDKGWYYGPNMWGPLPADTLTMLARKPFFNTWAVAYSEAYFLEPDKYWQGDPTPTNIRFFPILKTFFNEWSAQYTYEPDKFWQGAPQISNTVKVPPTKPFANEWSVQYTWDSSATGWYWGPQWGPNPAETLTDLARQPFYKQWRYDFEPDKYWQGSPIQTNLRTFPFAVPFSKQWEYHLVPPTEWLGTPRVAASLTLPSAVKPFSKLWRYDYDSGVHLWQPYSVGIGTVGLLTEAGRPFGALWNYDLDWDKYWVGRSLPTAAISLVPPTPTHNQWRYDYDSAVSLWQRYSMPAVTQNILVEGGTPFHKQWRYDFEPDKFWQGAPTPTNLRMFPFVFPFSNEWFQQTTWDSGAAFWLGHPTAPYPGRIPVLNPFSNEWFFLPWDSGQAYWQGKPTGPTEQQLSLFAPFSKLWAPTSTWDSSATYWQGSPVPTNIRFFPFLEPFSNEWFQQYAWDSGATYWQGKPSGPFAPMIALPPPFFKSWTSTSTWDSGATLWQGAPQPTNPRFFPFALPSINMWSAWNYDSGATYWQGRPFNMFASGERIPVVPPRNMWQSLYTQDSDLHLWRFSDFVRQNAVTTFKFRVFPTGPMYLQETIDIPPFWQGHPLFLPPFLINVAIAVFNPEDMIPGHPLHPRRKDPLSWEGDDWRKLAIPDDTLWPRRKDPVKGRNR